MTPDGEIVWEYLNPVRRDDPDNPGKKLIPILSQSERISDDRAALFTDTGFTPPSNDGEPR